MSAIPASIIFLTSAGLRLKFYAGQVGRFNDRRRSQSFNSWVTKTDQKSWGAILQSDASITTQETKKVWTNLPSTVRVIAQELALLRSFLSEEINTILDIDET